MVCRGISRKSVVSLAVACLLGGAVCLLGAVPGNSAIFSATQQWRITDNGWNAVCELNYATNAWSCSDFAFGNNVVTYDLPFGAWKAFFLYDDPLGWDELVWVYDQNL